MAVVDWTDPCAKATALRATYYEIIQGQREQSVTVRNGDHESQVTYTKTELSLLVSELRQAESDCAAKNGTAGRRFAIRAGSRRY